eukprot:TRINITY_DN46825_c0_g1_i1.p1 TRINITY_DN46825_c0_g1~~TRINITY_DN46825_c0_g1_i1.p1  ORF type:complete len:711 (+),score=150.98 TRINITY_DN46825_c0_g1_i1:58-2133(+)
MVSGLPRFGLGLALRQPGLRCAAARALPRHPAFVPAGGTGTSSSASAAAFSIGGSSGSRDASLRAANRCGGGAARSLGACAERSGQQQRRFSGGGGEGGSAGAGGGGPGARALSGDGMLLPSNEEDAESLPDLAAGFAPGGDPSKEAGLEELTRPPVAWEAKRCAGCGSWLQSSDESQQGYIPEEARANFSPSGRKKVRKEPMGEPVDWVPDGVKVVSNPSTKYKVRTKLLICQRCYKLQHYHRTVPTVEGGFYRMEGGRGWEHEAEIVEKVVRRMRKGSLVLMVIDILDFESSLVPELFDACRNRQFPVIFVVNKVDCLPERFKGLERVKVWVRRMSRQIRNVHVNDVILVSSLNAYGFKQLEERLRHHLEPSIPRNIYVVGRVNAGKSTFVNRFLWYVGYKHQGTVHHKRTVGGITRSPVPGTTLHFVSMALPKGFRIVDTPGIPSRCQVSNLLREGIDLYGALPRKRLQPISYVLQTGRSLIVGALVRVDQVKGAISFASAFFSADVTLHVCRTARAAELMERKGGEFMYPPHDPEDCKRLGPLVRHRVEVFGSSDRAWDDIVIAGLGWIAISGFGTKELDVWVPKGVKVFRRPSLLPQEVSKRGVTRFHERHRGRGHRINRKKQGVVRARRDKELRDALREERERLEAERAELPAELDEGTAFVDDNVSLQLPAGYTVVKDKEHLDR